MMSPRAQEGGECHACHSRSYTRASVSPGHSQTPACHGGKVRGFWGASPHRERQDRCPAN